MVDNCHLGLFSSLPPTLTFLMPSNHSLKGPKYNTNHQLVYKKHNEKKVSIRVQMIYLASFGPVFVVTTFPGPVIAPSNCLSGWDAVIVVIKVWCSSYVTCVMWWPVLI